MIIALELLRIFSKLIWADKKRCDPCDSDLGAEGAMVKHVSCRYFSFLQNIIFLFKTARQCSWSKYICIKEHQNPSIIVNLKGTRSVHIVETMFQNASHWIIPAFDKLFILICQIWALIHQSHSLVWPGNIGKKNFWILNHKKEAKFGTKMKQGKGRSLENHFLAWKDFQWHKEKILLNGRQLVIVPKCVSPPG